MGFDAHVNEGEYVFLQKPAAFIHAESKKSTHDMNAFFGIAIAIGTMHHRLKYTK